MTATNKREFDMLEKAGLVLLALQFAVFAKVWIDFGFDRATDEFPLVFVMVTAIFIAAQRRLSQKPPNRAAARWIFASRATVLAMLALATAAIGFDRLAPDAVLSPATMPAGVFVLLWATIALKGAGVGKLKPGGAMGLRVPWTMQSRLAWDRAHRVLGRVLFWGGLTGLALSLAIPPLASIAMWVGTVALALAAALIESWRTWRLDPHRGSPA